VEEERNMKCKFYKKLSKSYIKSKFKSLDFGALLTGRSSIMLKRDEMLNTYSTKNPQNIAATGRFSFHKKSLYYSFYVSEKAARPRAIQFIDNAGNILEEQSLIMPSNGPNSTVSLYQNATGKICGVWRLPRTYRRLLKEEQM
jgi:chordin